MANTIYFKKNSNYIVSFVKIMKQFIIEQSHEKFERDGKSDD